MRFTLSIDMGNDAMRTPVDLANALADVAHKLENWGRDQGSVYDANGNKVGSFEIEGVQS